MLVAKLSDGGLLLYSPVKITDMIKSWLDTLGPVTFIVSPDSAHTLFVKSAATRYPDAAVVAGLTAAVKLSKAGVRVRYNYGVKGDLAALKKALAGSFRVLPLIGDPLQVWGGPCGVPVPVGVPTASVPQGGGVSAGGNFLFQIAAKSPPSPRHFFLRNPGHLLLLWPAAIFFFCGEVLVPVYCMSGPVFMPVHMPKICFLCILSIPKTDFVRPVCIPKDFFVCPLCIPRTMVPATVHQIPNFGGAEIFPTRKSPQPPPPVLHAGQLAVD